MLQGRENEILLRKWSPGTAQLSTFEVTLSAADLVSRDRFGLLCAARISLVHRKTKIGQASGKNYGQSK